MEDISVLAAVYARKSTDQAVASEKSESVGNDKG